MRDKRHTAGRGSDGRKGRTGLRAMTQTIQRAERGTGREFPFLDAGASPFADIDRRSFLKAMSATLAFAGLSGCSFEPDEDALPYVQLPEGETQGQSRWYATAFTFAGYAQPVLGRTYGGRPVKLEGNPDHPASRGATDAITQAALLGLYDPERSDAPRQLDSTVAWSRVESELVEKGRRLDRTEGEGFRLVTGRTTSPTLIRQIKALLERWPKARWHQHEPAEDAAQMAAVASLTGGGGRLFPRLDRARTIVSLDADFLGIGPCQTWLAGLYGDTRRGRQEGIEACHLTVAEPVPSITGAMADRRLPADPMQIRNILLKIADLLGIEVPSATDLAPPAAHFAEEAADRLTKAGSHGLLLLGRGHPEDCHRLALMINGRLGALGSTLLLLPEESGAPAPFEDLLADLQGGEVSTLMMLGVNPAYTAGGDGFAELIGKAGWSLHAGLYVDETAVRCRWHLPLAHDLERWSDARAVDGTACLLQPLIRPFRNVRSDHEILAMLEGRPMAGREIVQQTWRVLWDDAFEARWLKALAAGYVEDSAPAALAPAILSATLPQASVAASTADPAGLTLVLQPDPTIWDGRFGENAWLQETPKPQTKLTWGNVLTIGPALARARGLKTGDEVTVSTPTAGAPATIWVMPGQAEGTVALTLGYGRTQSGTAECLGTNAYLFRTRAEPWLISGIRIEKTGETRSLASTQRHQSMEGEDFVRTVPFKRTPPEAQPAPDATHQSEEQATFYPPWPVSSPSWGMTIDLDLCIGCNACVVACVAENNIPMVGKDLVAEGREMHWIRIDQYQEGPEDNPDFHFQPVPCMHCEQAPCEMGCPVNATVHSEDGLNLQVYNRCIGTRTCSSYCPYKVRRFNWFDYVSEDAESLKALRNPDVTVRMRGVMEKCTYCVQRIEQAKIAADREGRPLADGEVVTACQQVCPTRAIQFGDVTQENSMVSRLKSSGRNYALLEEANTRPRTTYLKRVVLSAEDRKGGHS